MRIFFKGLNELRGIAATLVVVSHIELYKSRENIANLYQGSSHDFIEHLGKNGVYLFFVLSGFLITYLLLSELHQKNDVDATKFYVRRVLRIWPLYYFMVGISFVVFPAIVQSFHLEEGSYYNELTKSLANAFDGRLSLFLLFLPNLALILYPPVAGISQSWSVGVEEQFYLLWPQILKRSKERVLSFLIGVILAKFILLYSFILLNSMYHEAWMTTTVAFLKMFRIELMALGGVGAYLLINKKLDKLYEKISFPIKAIVVVLIFVFLWFEISYFLLGLLFLILILLNINDRHFILRNLHLSFAGDISYGIYMYHPIVMFFTFSLVNSLISHDEILIYNSVIYTVTIGGTIMVSYISYNYFESFFLRLKEKFVVVPSGVDKSR
jgi:peptidoglycan/LPS O-acetylase OafA/YrhL